MPKVWVSTHRGAEVYHTDRDCYQLSDAAVTDRVDRDEVADRTLCAYCDPTDEPALRGDTLAGRLWDADPEEVFGR